MFEAISFIMRNLLNLWYVFLPLFLIQIVWEKFKTDRRKAYIKKFLKYEYLELKFPEDIYKSPRAMEEVLNALHALHPNVELDLNWWSLNFRGFIPKSYTFLMMAHNGKLRFYLRFPQGLKDFVKSRIYSQYQEIYLEETDNPFKDLPLQVPNSLLETEIYDVRLVNEDIYPIKTYTAFENLPEDDKIDPVSTFTEGATQLSDKEWLVFQIIVIPTTGDNPLQGKKWVERGKKEIEKLLGKEKKVEEPSILEEIEEFTVNLLLAIFREPIWREEAEKKEEKEIAYQSLPPYQRKVIEAIQSKIGKPGYWSNIRVAYIASKDLFKNKKETIFSLIKSVFKTFETEDLNKFTLNVLTYKYSAFPFVPFLLKRKEYYEFINFLPIKLSKELENKFRPKGLESGFILNSEELASIFHPPMGFVLPTGFERFPFRQSPPPFK